MNRLNALILTIFLTSLASINAQLIASKDCRTSKVTPGECERGTFSGIRVSCWDINNTMKSLKLELGVLTKHYRYFVRGATYRANDMTSKLGGVARVKSEVTKGGRFARIEFDTGSNIIIINGMKWNDTDQYIFDRGSIIHKKHGNQYITLKCR